MYGVIWNGKELYEYAKELMHDLIINEKLIYVLSNRTQSSEEVSKECENRGLIKDQHYHKFITSGSYFKSILQNGKLSFKAKNDPKNVFIFGSTNIWLFEGTKYQIVSDLYAADFVYVSIPQLNESGFNSYQKKEYLKEGRFDKIYGRMWDSLVIDPFIPFLKQFKQINLPILAANIDLTAEESVRGEITSFEERNVVIRQ
ncbi:MAG: hypothetical protein EZS28_026547 [Streblomastix strix]|uniref:Uncharacterized protein n=1 Tax=Streblomastix strix TaxID=222440 RepID=A0A5J4V698_9EUKA|nr:MAG: hypothetical protein EZS28_026547 [Streblomastix strix]